MLTGHPNEYAPGNDGVRLLREPRQGPGVLPGFLKGCLASGRNVEFLKNIETSYMGHQADGYGQWVIGELTLDQVYVLHGQLGLLWARHIHQMHSQRFDTYQTS